jgi:glucose-6-phosphate 1-dehydrogenase
VLEDDHVLTEPMGTERTFVIFGADGDLSKRLLLPGLAQLLRYDPERRVRLIGVGMTEFTAAEWVERVNEATDGLTSLAKQSRYIRMDATDEGDLSSLIEEVGSAAAYYFAVPPAVAFKACTVLQRLGLPAGSTLALEKPFGTDQRSAREFNALLDSFGEGVDAFRVDHFLGKATVLSIIALRFANRMLGAVWNSEQIESVDIVFDETLALEGRAGYYDHAGALRDMIQSHLLHIAALIAMEPPRTVASADLHSAMADVLEATRVWASEPVASSRRARYTAGVVGEEHVPDYSSEKGVDPANHTETLAEMKLQINTDRWRSVPFTLRSGKALGQLRTEIIVKLRASGALPEGFEGDVGPRYLRLGIETPSIDFDIMVNGADNPLTLEVAHLRATMGEGALGAYGEVLAGLLDGDPLLSVGARGAEACWRIVAPVLEAWAADRVPLDEYPAGSGGPASWSEPL